jgi:signal transduction histidine kinase
MTDLFRKDAGLRIAAIYSLVAGLWIYTSDSILGWLFSDPVTLTKLAMLKGWGFVAVTAGMLYSLVKRDIAEVRRMEGHLRQAQKLESLGLLAGGIAHDFNNLLMAMLGNLNLAQHASSPGDAAAPYLENVEKTIYKASELTKQMLAYSGKGDFQVSPQDLNQVIRDTTQLLQVSISKKITLRFQLASELPAIKADGVQIQQVIMNLVTNASDAIGDREGTITISSRVMDLDRAYIASAFPSQTLRPGTYAVLEVSDTGCGMDPEILARIFDPFFTTKKEGRGLGLSTMLGTLRGHDAGLKIYSEVGRGSTFKLFFPAHPGGLPAVGRAEVAAPSRFSGRVLVVDDEPLILDSTAALLTTLGFRTDTAFDGQDAVEKFEADPDGFDLVFMDLTMPRMNGHEAFSRMRALRPKLPIILCSGYSEQDIAQGFQDQACTGFLQKPYLLADLKHSLLACLPAK